MAGVDIDGQYEAHGESWAPGLGNAGDDDNLHDGLAELGLGADPEMEENDYDPAAEQVDDFALQSGYDDPNMLLEAEEEAPRPMSAALRKKQREHEEHLALLEQVKALCIKMEKALEDDQEDLLNGKPGLRKLQMISEIEACASQVKAHPLLLQSGFLGLLKGFLEPLKTPRLNANEQHLLALPHLQIRQLVYKLLAALPISTQQQEGRNILKTSEIGRVLRFYSKVKHETEANRRVVSELLNRWMLPIIEEGRKAVRDEQNENLRLREREHDMRRRRHLDQELDIKQAKRLEEQQQGNQVGDAGYRYHARVPKMQRPDYVHAPTISAHVCL